MKQPEPPPPPAPELDLFHHCAFWAWADVYEATGQWPPDSELTRRRAYELYEQALVEKSANK